MVEVLKGNRRMLVYLLASNFILFFGFQVWQTLFNNFAVEELGAGPVAIGAIQGLREVPGLLGLLIGVFALYISEVRIMALSIALLGVGIILTGASPTVPFLALATFVMSLGFHFFYPTSNAVVLMVVDQKDAPKTLGSLGSLSAIASVAAAGTVLLLAKPMGYRPLFVVVGLVAVVGGLLLLRMRDVGGTLPPNRRVVLRRRYWLYYTLSFLMGSRRHIFTTFAILLLVREYEIGVQATALLFLVNSVVNIYTLRLAGQLVGRFGERAMLSCAFGALVLVFLGYAFIESLPMLFVLFVIDNILFGFNLALTTYFQKIAVSPEEITSNLATEQAINHIAAVIIPVMGGAAWALFGSQAPFLFGAGIVLVALGLTQLIRTPVQPAVAPVPAGG